MQKSRQKTVEVGGVRRPVVMRPLDALVPYARNARTHSDAQVAQMGDGRTFAEVEAARGGSDAER